MARIRRHSMERLELYDLDNISIIPSSNRQLTPPVPAPRKHRRSLPKNSTFGDYQFLCSTIRNETDPVYAATPMFRTIPQSSHVKYHRQLLGSHVPEENIKPVSTPSTGTSKDDTDNDSEEKKEEQEEEEEEQEEEKEEEEEEEEEKAEDDDNDDDDDGDKQSSSSSSSSDDDDDDDDDGDDDNKGIVQKIFDREKQK